MSRIDVFLVENDYFKTRSKAQLAIKDGIVFCNGKKVTKTGFDVKESDKIEIIGDTLKYVSRGGLKLEKALQEWNISLNGKIMIDIGSSTGGFSDVAVQNGIFKIYAIDVGTDQFDKELSKNPKIHLFEQTDFRTIDKEIIEDADIATIDVSFISAVKIAERFQELPNIKEVICLIKPQFECGIEIANKFRGVIKSEEERMKAVKKVTEYFKLLGFKNIGITESPIKGGDGNIEYLAYFIR